MLICMDRVHHQQQKLDVLLSNQSKSQNIFVQLSKYTQLLEYPIPPSYVIKNPDGDISRTKRDIIDGVKTTGKILKIPFFDFSVICFLFLGECF